MNKSLGEAPMSRIVQSPPESTLRPDGSLAGGWWRDEPDGRILCELCPRACRLKPGDRGFCFVRQNVDNEMLLTTYGRSTGFCIDPIEKKPLNHFLPGTSVLSFGTAGCNLGCRFCQNWDISKSREVERLSELAMPEMIAAAAQQHGCHSVAFTYNDPVIWAEYAIDTAAACRAVGVKAVAVTAGYITPAARPHFFHAMDAANVDLKAFTEQFYYELTASHLEPVLETLEWLKHESDVWFEITNLIIPQANDSHDELKQMCEWILERIGDDTPIHFTAFHPDFRMQDRGRTPHATLLEAKAIAQRAGVKFAYVGNVDDARHQSTYCPACDELLIERNWYQLGRYGLKDHHCGGCGEPIPGRFLDQPGDWGPRRLPVRIAQFRDHSAPSREEQSAVTNQRPATPSDTPPSSSPAELVQIAAASPTPPVSPERERPMTESTAANVPILPDFSSGQETAIHRAAAEIVAAAVNNRPMKIEDASLDGAAEKIVMGAFVTLKREGKLRACCGSLGAPMNVAQAVGGASRRTALEDTRLPPISPSELPYLHLDVTLLFGFEIIEAEGEDRAKEVEIGAHGLQIRRGEQSGLLLPSVAVEHDFSPEEFLRQVCGKAGLPSNAWTHPDTILLRFRGHSIGDDFPAEQLSDSDSQATARFQTGDAERLAEHCKQNVLALAGGGTPSYYASGAADGDVMGAVLSVTVEGVEAPIQVGALGMRNRIPLQSSLNSYCGEAIKGLPKGATAEQVQVDVAILEDSAMHGTAAEPDLRGFDPKQRALVISDGGKVRWRFDPQSNGEDLLAYLREATPNATERSQLYSLGVVSSRTPIEFSNIPRPLRGPTDRPPAVAGAFYPIDIRKYRDQLIELIDPQAEKQTAPAVMMPHAGWAFSGKVAGEAISQVEIPETVIVIGPKHTAHGSQWAVAPHRQWLLPSGAVASDPELAERLAEEIPGLELDAAAHAREHGIEVELPLIQALSPESRVVGIVIGGGTLEQMEQFAEGLARVIDSLDAPPLLVVSSDMNHYATDEENRRLDAMALDALETADAEKLYETCRDHNISMCGLMPAVVVIKTLQRLGRLEKITRTGYATSADSSGDKQRVVGYAGAVFH